MRKLITIGGGSFQKQETRAIDTFVIVQCAKKTPRVLFLPAAANDDQGYGKRFKQYYRSLGCEVEQLRLWHTKLSEEEIRERILACDILYIGGGNTRRLIQILTTKNIFPILLEAYQSGIVCVGYSAGANIWFDYGLSDLYDDGSEYAYVEGMHVISGAFHPHAYKCEEIQNRLLPTTMIYACGDGEALVFFDDILVKRI